jgi:PAS domain S-box-containing protein
VQPAGTDGGTTTSDEDVFAREAAERLAFAANAVPALLAYVGSDLRYLWVNEGYRRWYGRARNAFVGRHVSEVLDAATWSNIRPHLGRALTGEEVTFENRLVIEGRPARDVRVSCVPHRDGGGCVRGFVVLVSDITETKSVERALRRSERMLEQAQAAAQVGSWELAYDEHLAEIPGSALWSAETYRILGCPPGTSASRAQFRERVHPADREALQARIARGLQHLEPSETEYRIVRPDGTLRVLHAWLHFERTPDGKTTQAFGTCQDITPRRLLERERERALQDLQEADRRKDEFLAMLAHELRNPLAPILNGVEILERLRPEQEELAGKYRTMIARQAGHMKRLLDDLLDVSRVSQGKIQLHKQRLDLNLLLQQAIEATRPPVAQRRHTLRTALAARPMAVEADPTRMVQVFTNLINNAAKYTDAGGHITVTSVAEEGEAVVSVRDDGVGMTPELLTRAFDLFVQETRALDRAEGGLGIGLTLVRTLVKMHGGSVRAFSAGPGLGSELVVRLPLAPPAEPFADGQTAEARQPAGGRLRVLIVDDNVDAATAVGQLLEMQGHEVALSADGPAALAAAATTPPDVILLDIGLPGMDGYEVAARLRAAGHTRAALVALTGYGRDSDVQRSREAGFDHHLVKPVDLGRLQKIAAELRERRG